MKMSVLASSAQHLQDEELGFGKKVLQKFTQEEDIDQVQFYQSSEEESDADVPPHEKEMQKKRELRLAELQEEEEYVNSQKNIKKKIDLAKEKKKAEDLANEMNTVAKKLKRIDVHVS